MGTPGGGALFSFHTDAQHIQPFLDVTQPGATALAPLLGIELANSNSSTESWPQSPIVDKTNLQAPTQFLVPNPIPPLVSNGPGSVPTTTATRTATPAPSSSPNGLPQQYYEPGMPVLGANGTVIGMYLSGNGQNQLTLTQISAESDNKQES